MDKKAVLKELRRHRKNVKRRLERFYDSADYYQFDSFYCDQEDRLLRLIRGYNEVIWDLEEK